MPMKPIESEEKYLKTLKEIVALMSAELDTPEGTRLDQLCTRVEEYEKKYYGIDANGPLESNMPNSRDSGLGLILNR